MTVLDARGLSCPEPVILLRNAMKTKAAVYQITVNHPAALENVTRYAESQGYQVAAAEQGGEYTLSITK